MKKEFLFKYLHAKRVSVEASADKSVFVAAVLQLWGSHSLPEAPARARIGWLRIFLECFYSS